MRKNLTFVLCVLMLAGCQTLGMKMNDDHSKTHSLDVQITGKNKRFSKNIDVSHRAKQGDVNLVLIGDIERPMGALVSLVKVKAKFMNEKGEIIREEDRNAYFRNYGSRGMRKYRGTFYIEVPDDTGIVRCEVEFV